MNLLIVVQPVVLVIRLVQVVKQMPIAIPILVARAASAVVNRAMNYPAVLVSQVVSKLANIHPPLAVLAIMRQILVLPVRGLQDISVQLALAH